MSRTWRALAALGALLLFGGVAASPAEGQSNPAPSAQPPASAQPKGDKPADRSKPSADGRDSSLPPGHPPIDNGPAQAGDDELPAGHPPVDERPAAHGQPKRGGRGGKEPGIFRPPVDSAQEDTALPPGTLIATIKDANDQPIPRARITLGILHSTVTKGDSSEDVERDANADGTFRFENLAVGSGVRYRVSTTKDGATYAIGSIQLNDKAGKRAVLHAYEASSNLQAVAIMTQSDVFVTLREDALHIEQAVSALNFGKVTWMPVVTMALPAGAKAFNKQEAPDGPVVEESGGRVTLRGTYAPGQHGVDFTYQIPLKDEDRQTIRIELPPNVVQVRVFAEASKSMSLDVNGYPPAQRTESRTGKKLLATGWRADSDQTTGSVIEITVGGLPVKGPARWIALTLALLALTAGFAYVYQKRGDGSLDVDARGDLIEAREALLREIVALERARNTGEIGPKTYARLRASLLDALARIVGTLEDARDADVAARKRRRTGRPEAAT